MAFFYLHSVNAVFRLVLSFFIFIAFLFHASDACAYYSFDNKISEAYRQIFDLEFDKAQVTLDKEKVEKPGNDLVLLYYGYSDFLRAFLSENEADLAALKKNNTRRLSRLEERKDVSSPWYNYARAELMMQEAMVKIKFREYISAVSLFVKANGLVEKNRRTFPSFLLNNKLEGIINIVAGSVPRQFQWLSNMAGITGTVSQGKERLIHAYQAISNSELNCYRPELLFYLSMAESIYSTSDDKFPFWLKEYESYPSNGLLAFSRSNLMMKNGNNDDAVHVLTLALNDSVGKFPFLFYKRGLALLRKGEFDQAEKDFRSFLLYYRGMNYIKSAWQKLSWICLLKNDKAGYYQFRKKVTEAGSNFTDEDKEALYEAESKDIPDADLLMARLFFDGGYYDNALKSLLKINSAELRVQRDRLEYTYRMGRIMEKTGREDKALTCYQSVIDNGSNSPFYFAANSALLTGAIYEKRKEKDLALSYYKKVLSIKEHQYSNSIEQKAKAGMDRLK